ncbi:MAG: polysaccharide biosynthesis tyrosine autokinase [Salinisphaera sp.]|nr:polysaccharide biosynthesis tyrosine autokinase [Salinisphaera sp.]
MTDRPVGAIEDLRVDDLFAGGGDPPTPRLWDYLRVLLRYRKMIIALVVLAVGFAIFYVIAKAPVYRAELVLQVDPTAPNYGAVRGVEQAADEDTFFQTQYKIIASRSVARRVVEQLTPAQAGILLGSPGWFAGLTPQPQPVDKAEVQRQLVDAVRAGLSVHGRQDSQLVILSYTAPQPELAAEIANLVAQAYISFQSEARVHLTEEANQWLTEQLGDLRAELESSHAKLLAFKQEHGLMGTQSMHELTQQRLSGTSQELLNARAKLMQAKVLYEQTQDAQDSGGVDALVPVLSSPVIQQLKLRQTEAQRQLQSLLSHYGRAAPEVQTAQAELSQISQRLQGEIANQVAAIEKRYRAAKQRVAMLKQAGSQFSEQVRERSGELFQLAKLEREVQVNRNLFQTFLNRVKETGLASQLNVNHIRVIDKALVPGQPFLPSPKRAVGLALILSVFLGVALALVRQNLNQTFRTPLDLEQRLRLPGIGVLPKLRARSGQDFLQQVVREPRSPFAEAMGEIRTRLQVPNGQGRPQVIMVTSAIPGEGKSTLSSNLASAFSQLGSTLLLDADLRKSSLRRLGNREGLTDLLRGADSQQCIARDQSDENLFVLGSGSHKTNPQGSLSAPAMTELFARLRERFDTIIVDTAPVLAVSDALILGRHVDGVVLAVKAAATPFDVVSDCVRRLRSASIPILGLTLSQVDLNTLLRDGGYAYGHY